MIKPTTLRITRRSRRLHALTMMEVMASFSVLLLIGGGFMSLYMNMLSVSARVGAISYTAWDSANAIDQLTVALREARRFEFMDNGTTGPTAYQNTTNAGNNSNYFQTLSSSTVVTGIHIVFPAALSTVKLNIPSATGYTSTTMTGTDGLVDYRTDGAYMDVYRSDAQGHPAPSNGTCLWMRGTLNGVTIPTDPAADTSKGIDGRPLCDNIASWAGAVQFIQGQANEVQIKIVTGVFSRTNGQITSDSSKGAVTGLTAEHVYLRNHDPNGVTSGSAHGKTQYQGN